MTGNSIHIERQAAEWAAKSEHGRLPEAEQHLLDQWLNADQRHYGAYMKALAVQIHLAKIGRANPSLAPASLKRPRYQPSRRLMMAGAIAASLLLIVTLAGLNWPKYEKGSYDTALGAVKVVALVDGSVMTLNSGTTARIDYDFASRGVALTGGEALFDVAKNKLRPFRVAARGIHVRAVGTSFAVKNIPGSPLQVLVREGVVAIETAGRAEAVKVAANTRAVIADDGTVRTEDISQSEIQNRLAWRYGYIFLARQRLVDVAAEFARYSPTKIVIADQAVGQRVVSGLFKTSDPTSFAYATAQALHLKVEKGSNTIRLSAAPNNPDK